MKIQIKTTASQSNFALRLVLILAFYVFSVSTFAQSQNSIMDIPQVAVSELLSTPGDHQAFIDAISAPTTRSIKMSMFHLSDEAVIHSLIAAARKGVVIEIILDRSHFSSPATLAIAQDLVSAGIKVKASVAVFNITHTKYMLINNNDWFVTSINLTTEAATTLDLGVRGSDNGIFSEILSVFTMDFNNGDSDLQSVATEQVAKASQPYQPSPDIDLGPYTPPLSNKNLVWSPTDSAKLITDLIHSAQSSIILTVENLRYQTIQDALVDAVSRGVSVQVLVPQVDMNPDSNFNLPALLAMNNVSVNGKTVSVESRMMPGPATANTPYIHLKMIVADKEKIYIGSENFTYNSLIKSRELGIIFSNRSIALRIQTIFEPFFARGVVPVALPPKPVGAVPTCASLF